MDSKPCGRLCGGGSGWGSRQPGQSAPSNVETLPGRNAIPSEGRHRRHAYERPKTHTGGTSLRRVCRPEQPPSPLCPLDPLYPLHPRRNGRRDRPALRRDAPPMLPFGRSCACRRSGPAGGGALRVGSVSTATTSPYPTISFPGDGHAGEGLLKDFVGGSRFDPPVLRAVDNRAEGPAVDHVLEADAVGGVLLFADPE
jgi:hypothetical protein